MLDGLVKPLMEKEYSVPASRVELGVKERVMNSSLFRVLQVREVESLRIPVHVGETGGVIASGTLIYILSPSVKGELAMNENV